MLNKTIRNTLGIVMASAVLAACSTNDVYQDRAENQRKLESAAVKSTLRNMPKWMTDLPESESAIYQSGSASSANLSMSRAKALNEAYGKICMTNSGTVSQQTQTFISDTGNSTVENSEMAIRSACTSTGITGVEVADVLDVKEDNRYRTYILIALPIGEANVLLERKLEQEIQEKALERSEEAFEEIDAREEAQSSE